MQLLIRCTHFQGLPEASRAWFSYTCGPDGFLQNPPSNLTPNISDPCVLLWREPPTLDPKTTGKVTIGISTDDNLECITQNKASRDHLLIIWQAYADHGIEYIVTNLPDQIIGIAISYTPTSITLTQPTQIYDLQNLFYPNDASVPITWTPLSSAWSEETRNFSSPTSIDLHRSAVGILLFLGRSRFDSINTISRHSSRTTQHTQLDYLDMSHHVAYIITTRHIGKTYYASNRPDNSPYLLTSTSNYGHGIYSNELGQLGTAIVGGYGFRQQSAPIYATSNKDIGLLAITTPDGELKALIKVVKTTLDLIELVTDLSYPQPAVPIEIDSQAVQLVARDFS